MNGPTCVWNPIVREPPYPQHPQISARWPPAKWSYRELRSKSPSSGRDISDVTEEADGLRMNLRQAKHALATRDEETRRLRAAVTHLESVLARRERELRDTVHRLQRVAASKQDHIEHLNRQASLGFLREAREQADEYRVEAKRLARALAAISGGVGNPARHSPRPTDSSVPQLETTEPGVLLVPGFGQDWSNHNQVGQARAATVADRHSRFQPLEPKPRRLHTPGHSAPHPTAEPGGDRGAREFRARPDGKNTWPIPMRKCLEDRSGEHSLQWGSSTVRGQPPAPTGDRYATWRDDMPYDSLGLRPQFSLSGAGTTAVSSSSAVVADEVPGGSPPARRTVLSRRSTGRASDGVECWGPRQGHCSRGSSRRFDGTENARTSSMACSARLRLSAQQITAERNVALALVEESRRVKAARAERKRRVRFARQKIARYRSERIRELESRHARRYGPRPPQIHRQMSAIHEEQPRGSERGDGNQDKGEGVVSYASDDRNDKVQHSKQRRTIEAAIAAAVGAATSCVGQSRRLHAAEDEPSSCYEGGIERRGGSHGGQRRGLQGSVGDSGEEAETWHGRDCGRDHGSPAWPSGKPPLAPSRAVPSKTLSPQGQSEVTDGRSDGTDEGVGFKKGYAWDEENDADGVHTEATSTRGIDNADECWGDQGEDDDDRNGSVCQENISSRGWNCEEGSASRGGGPAHVKQVCMGTEAVMNPGESCRGRLDCVKPLHDNSSRRLEGLNCRGSNERDIGLSDGPMCGAGLQSGVPTGKRWPCTESEPSSSAIEPSTYALALPVMAMGEGIAGADRPVARVPRQKTRVRGGNVGGTGNVVQHNVKSGRTPTLTLVGTDESTARGGQDGGERGAPTDDLHHRGERREGKEYTKRGSITKATLPPDSEIIGRSTASQACEGNRALRVVADNHRFGGEGRKARDNGSATKKRTGNTHVGGEKREEQIFFRGEEQLDDDGSCGSRWSRSEKDAAQERGALKPETSVGVERISGVAARVPEYQDDFFSENSARQYQEADISFAVSPPSEEESEAFGATSTSPPVPVMMSVVPPPDSQPRPNSPSRDPAGDDWLIREPPAMITSKTCVGEASGRRSLRRPNEVGENMPVTRPLSPLVPVSGTERTREMDDAYSVPVNASSQEREAGLRTLSAGISTVASVEEIDAASPEAIRGRQNLSQEAGGDDRNACEGKVGLDDQRRETALGEKINPAVKMGVSRDGGAAVGKDDQSSGRVAEPLTACTIAQEQPHAPVDRQDAVFEQGDRSKRVELPIAAAVTRHDVSGTHELVKLDTGQTSPENQTIMPGGTRTVGGNSIISNPGGGGVAMTALDLAASLGTLSWDSGAPDSRHTVDAAGRGKELASRFPLPIEDAHDVGNTSQATASLDTEPPPAGSPPHVGHCSASGGRVIDVGTSAGQESTLTCGPVPVDSNSGPSVIGRSASSPNDSPRQSLTDDDDDDGLNGYAGKTLRPSLSSPTASSDIREESTVGSRLMSSLGRGDKQPREYRAVLEGDARSAAPRSTLSSPAVSSGSQAEFSVDCQPTSSREGDTSATRTTLDGSTVNTQVGEERLDGHGSSSAVSATEESPATGEHSSLSSSVLDGDDGGSDTVGNDDGYF